MSILKDYMYFNDNPYIAIDGSEHMEMSGVVQSNINFWNSILKYEDMDNIESLRETYKKIIEMLWYRDLDYNVWNGFYEIFKNGVANDMFSDSFTKVFSKGLLNARVMCVADIEVETYLSQQAVISNMVDGLSQPGRK